MKNISFNVIIKTVCKLKKYNYLNNKKNLIILNVINVIIYHVKSINVLFNNVIAIVQIV